MKIVYIAHPIGGDVVGNLEKITSIVRNINRTQPNIVPLVPYYADCLALDDTNPEERARGLQNGQAILKSDAIDELWLFGDRISDGMLREICTAALRDIPIIPKTQATADALEVEETKEQISFYQDPEICILTCESCEKDTDMDTMTADDDSNWFCPSCWDTLKLML